MACTATPGPQIGLRLNVTGQPVGGGTGGSTTATGPFRPEHRTRAAARGPAATCQWCSAARPSCCSAGPYPSLRLITCGGPFDSADGQYLDNIVIYSHLIS